MWEYIALGYVIGCWITIYSLPVDIRHELKRRRQERRDNDKP